MRSLSHIRRRLSTFSRTLKSIRLRPPLSHPIDCLISLSPWDHLFHPIPIDISNMCILWLSISPLSRYPFLHLSLNLVSVRFLLSPMTYGTNSYMSTSSGIPFPLIWILLKSIYLNVELLIMYSWWILYISNPSMMSFFILSFTINILLYLSTMMIFMIDTSMVQLSLNVSFEWIITRLS